MDDSRVTAGAAVGAASRLAPFSSSRSRLAQAAVAAPFLALLACLIGQLTAGRAIIWTADSLSYVYPGIRLAAGADPTGLLDGRNVGYSLATALVLPLGGLRALVTLQALLAAGGLAALLLCFRMVARNAYAFGVGGLLIVTAAYASDSFVLYSQMIRGDSLFGSLLSIALWLFLAAWGRTGGARAGFLIGAAALSYAAYTFEPNGLLVLALAAGALAIFIVRSPRLLLQPRIGGAVAGLLALALSVQAYQAHIATKDGGFAPRALFCAHLDTILFHPAAATPERRALWGLLDGMGRDANRCVNEPAVLDAIHAAAKADGMADGPWMNRQFLAAAARHPKADVADILKQFGFYLRHPNLEPDLTYPSAVSDPDWERLSAYGGLIKAPRAELDRPMGSWFAQRHRVLATFGKHLVGLVIRTLWLTAALALATAAIRLVRRRRLDRATERVYVGLSAFVLAAVLSAAIPFTFAIPRYAASFANLTYLWWSVGLTYLIGCWLRLPAMGATASLIRKWAGPRAHILSVGNVALAISALLTAGLITLQLGAVHVDQTFIGPFAAEQAEGSQLKSIAPRPLGALDCCLQARSDGVGHDHVSDLRLWVNDRELLPSHTPHDEIRKGRNGFSHWGTQVYFALPEGVENSSRTEVRLNTSARPDAWTMLFPAMTLALLIGLHGRRIAAWLVRRTRSSSHALAYACGNLALAICVALSLGWMALQLGAASLDQTFTGPFSGEQTAGSQLKTIGLKPIGPLSCCVELHNDAIGHDHASDLRLWVNDRELLPAHQMHDEMRKGRDGFSHWGNQVYFALPPGTSNSNQTKVWVKAPLGPPAWALLVPAMTLALFIRLHGRRTVAWLRSGSASASLAIKSPYLVLSAFGWAVLVAGAAYLATMLWGLATGEALPPSIPFRSDLGQALVDALDPAIPLCLLALALFGVASGWLTARWTPNRNVLREAEISGIRWLRRYGLFCLAMFYLASVGATWAGTWRSGTSQTVLGLVPIFDGMAYFQSAHMFLHDGRMGETLSRRPLAGALRMASFGVSDFRYGVVLLWQVAAMAGATFFATMTIARWRGLWAGVVFVALAYIAVRTHLATLLTEPLGLPIAFVALGFLAEAFRTSSKGHALLGLGLLSAALWVRPGAMFVIPGLALWFAWSFHETPTQKLKGFVIACLAIIAVIAVDKLVGFFFASRAFDGELADSLCGLSLGGGWSACLTTYPQEYAKVAQSLDGQTAWLYAKTLYNIQHDPSTLIRTILREATVFWTDAPRVLLQGYSTTNVPQAFPATLWLLTATVLGVLSLRKRNARVEAPFWIVVWAGLTTSAMVVYLSDGVRAMAVTYPLLALFVAAVFSSPIAPPIQCARTARREVRLGTILTVAATAGLFVLLPAERLISPWPRASLGPGESPSDTAIMGHFAGSTGMLVVADDQPLPHGVPSVHFSRFARIVGVSNIQDGQGIIEPRAPHLPFGFVEMPTLNTGGSRILITPPEMVTRRDVHAWRVVFEGWNPTGRLFSDNWVHVVKATPYSYPAGR